MNSGTISRFGTRFGVVAGLLAALSGCSDDEPTTATTTGAGGDATGGAGGEAQGGGGAGQGGAGGSADALEVLASFDPAAGELAEGLALHDDGVYVGFAMTGAIVRADVTPIEYAQVDGLPVENAFVTGLAFDGQGRLYAAVPSFVASPVPGVYRAAAGGGAAALFATDAAMIFPNAIGFHSSGDMYVTDAMAGAVFRVTEDGTVSLFLQDPLLAGDKTICGNDAALFDIGANGLSVSGDALFVANTDQATLLRIPIESGGVAGTPEIIAGPDCAALGGIDGISRAADGSFYAALNRQHAIARITTSGDVSVVLEDPRLDFPATVRLSPTEDALYITNFALEHALSGEPANPALLRWTIR